MHLRQNHFVMENFKHLCPFGPIQNDFVYLCMYVCTYLFPWDFDLFLEPF